MADGDSSNVVPFPKKHLRPETLAAELKTRSERAKEYWMNDQICRYMEQAAEGFQQYDIDISTDEFNRDFSYMQDIIAAIFYRMMGFPHPLHKTLDTGRKETLPNGSEIWVFDQKRERKKKTVANSGNVIVAVVDVTGEAEKTNNDIN